MDITKLNNKVLFQWFATHPVKLTNRRDKFEFGISDFKNSTDWYLHKYGHLLGKARIDGRYYIRHYGKCIGVK